MCATSCRQASAPADDCSRELGLNAIDPPTLFTIGEEGEDLFWRLTDQGPYDRNALLGTLAPNQRFFSEDDIETSLRQRVIVLDRQAPLMVVPDSFAQYATGPLEVGAEIDIGSPRVSDLADPNPIVTSDAPDTATAWAHPHHLPGGRRVRQRLPTAGR